MRQFISLAHKTVVDFFKEPELVLEDRPEPVPPTQDFMIAMDRCHTPLIEVFDSVST